MNSEAVRVIRVSMLLINAFGLASKSVLNSNKIITNNMKHIFTLLFVSFSLIGFSQQQAILAGQWSDTTLVGSSQYDNTYNEIWGLVHNGVEYAVIGSTAGTHFIDVTDATNPTEVAFVGGKTQGAVIIHRDYHDYKGYLYAVADEGASSLQIIDYSDLPNSVNVVYDSDTLIRRSHNIFIDTAKHKLYSLANSTPSAFQAMGVYDLTNPTNPVFMNSYSSFGGSSFGHVHDAFVRNDTAYLNCGYDGFHVVDFSDMANPTPLGLMTTYPGQGYNHSGWLNDKGDYYYMADENHDKPIKVVSTDDLTDLEVIQSFDAGATHSYSIPHNVIFHNDKLYTSYYYDGLQVYDLTDPANPVRTHYYDTYAGQDRDNYEGAWGVYPFLPSGKILVSDMQSGLFVFSLFAVNTKEITDAASIKVFPSPFENQLNIQFENPNAKEDVAIHLMDVVGRVVADLGVQTIQSGANNLTLPIVQDLPKGVYFLNMVGENVKISKKVMR
jgi:choice-of-anchor B domain-containing protein